MKIYAIRDRLIGYYMAPFAGPDTHADVLAAVAQQVNGVTEDAICQAPHHFEIWTLGEVHEDGHINPKKEFIADCSSLIRTGLRRGIARADGPTSRESPTLGPQNESTSPPSRDRGHPATIPAAPPNDAQSARQSV